MKNVILSLSVLFIGLASAFADEAGLVSTNQVQKAESGKVSMRDAEDGSLDFSEWLGTAKGFLPIPIIITEPAVGYGGGLVLLFLHDSIKDRAQKVKERTPEGKPIRLPPPSVSGVAGFLTENGTWGGGVFHMGVWKEDTVRYLGGIGYANVNYDFYPSPDQPYHVPLSIEGGGLLQQMTFRVGESDFWAGANYVYAATKAKPDGGILPPDLIGDGYQVKNGGASGILEYDTRDNLFTPNLGVNCKGEWTHYDTWLGGDNQFDIFDWNNRGWYPIAENLVIGGRCDLDFSGGDIPFYMRPFVSMRGIPAMRYQGDYVVTAETELRWDVTTRWSAVGFLGAGWTANNSFSNITDSETYPAYGFGFRYLMARVFQLRAGLDFGFSEEGSAFYITTGNSWGR